MKDDMQAAISAMYDGGSESGMGGDQMQGGMSRQPKSPFVDSIDGDVARLLMPDGTSKEVPVRSLPPGTREGKFLDDSQGEEGAFFQGDIDMKRKRLSQGDDGGDIVL